MSRILFVVGVLMCWPLAASAEWSVFDPISELNPPEVEDRAWSAPIDAFILARLQQNGLTPAPPVDRRVWMRRVTYDLIGLPPEPEDVQAFLKDPRPDSEAMEDVVDRLLASPRYGERWGRHWLDVVRYADTDGFAIDEERLWLWRYRDYVIRVLNEDRPFDQFIREQIAGDEIKAGDAGKIAISYYRLGPWEADNMTAENRRQDYLNDVATNVGSAFLGLTIGCARCHDHKFDPIAQSDFYRLQAFFTPMQPTEFMANFLQNEKNESIQQRQEETVARRLEKIKRLRGQLKQKIAKARKIEVDEISDDELDKAIQQKTDSISEDDAKQLKKLKTDKEHVTAERRFESKVVAIRNPGQDEKFQATFVLKNGDPFAPGERVTPGFLTALPTWSEDLIKLANVTDASPGGRRKILARWLTDKGNPITPRVLVNRIWQYHFGKGIVATPNDFGANGSGPSHPKLLDFLASKLITNKWRLKPLHRELVLSRTYRSAIFHPLAAGCQDVDPNNRLLWRAHYRRLESEIVRDAVLATSGRIRYEMGGPGFLAALPAGMGDSFPFFKWKPSSESQRRRRSIYMFQRRNLVHPMMETFDGADLNMSCERRSHSVTAPQALTLLNGRLANENSLHLARFLIEQSDDDRLRVDRLFWRALSRSPTKTESEACIAFLHNKLQSYTDESDSSDNKDGSHFDAKTYALRDLCLSVFNTNEFLYLD